MKNHLPFTVEIVSFSDVIAGVDFSHQRRVRTLIRVREINKMKSKSKFPGNSKNKTILKIFITLISRKIFVIHVCVYIYKYVYILK